MPAVSSCVPLLTPGDMSVGLNTVGIYRVSGTNTQIQKLKSAFDRGKTEVDLYFCLLLLHLIDQASLPNFRLQKC
jgi:RhoGAP domain